MNKAYLLKKNIIFLAMMFIILIGFSFFAVYNFKVYQAFKKELKVVEYSNDPIFSARNGDQYWDNQNHVAGNCIIKDNKGNLLLFYYASSIKYGSAIGVAQSKDGNKFIRLLDKPVLLPGEESDWDGGGVSIFPGCVIQRQDGTYWMYYSGIKKGAPDFYWQGSGGIGLAFSKDLIHWDKFKDNPIIVNDKNVEWESQGIFEPSVIFTGDEFGGKGAFKMWYGGNNKSGRMGIGYAESVDGVHWMKYKNNPVLQNSNNSSEFDGYTVEVHDVIKFNNQYVMAYEATDEKFPSHFSIGLAFSKNGTDWEKSNANPILEGGMIGSWNSMGVYHPAIVINDNNMSIYFVGLDYKYDHQVGAASLNPKLLYNKW